MDLFSDLVTAVQDDLTLDSTSTLFPPALIKRALNRSKRKAEGLYRWSELQDSKQTGTVLGQEYYDYPDNWQADSIWKLSVDDVDLGDPTDFKDYLYEKENDFPNGETSIWGNQWRRYFITVDGEVPAANGNNNITIWGQKVTDPLVNDTDVTIFSYSMPDCNEAIVLEAEAILQNKGKETQDGQFHSLEAKQILGNAWGKIKQNKAKYEKTTPIFEVPDFFGKPKIKNTIGRF